MTTVAVFVFLLSPCALLFFLIKPNLFAKWFKFDLTRKKLIGLFTSLFVGSFVTIGVFTDTVNQNNTSPNPEVFGAEVIQLSPSPKLSPTPLENPTPTPLSTPEETPVPTIAPSQSPTALPKSVVSSTPLPTPTPKTESEVISITPKPTTNIQPVKVKSTAPTSSYSCSCSKNCSDMSSCDEAYYQLETCGCSKRDGDNDGVPCESICPGG